jgi:hypothetical protein
VIHARSLTRLKSAEFRDDAFQEKEAALHSQSRRVPNLASGLFVPGTSSSALAYLFSGRTLLGRSTAPKSLPKPDPF